MSQKFGKRPFYLDLFFWGCMGLGGLGWFFPDPGLRVALSYLIITAVLEELVFRQGLQQFFGELLQDRFSFGCGWANVLTSLLFAGVHFVHHPPLMAGLTFFPSLVFGLLWIKYRNVLPCCTVHFFYNFCYFYRL